jgi:hypothetical protein
MKIGLRFSRLFNPNNIIFVDYGLLVYVVKKYVFWFDCSHIILNKKASTVNEDW